ncbi:hypothetical protein [Candidatus Vesicomyidisocius sp. SY067_SCS001]|uniref:hypothetical protein n=1 Tax=Candidatus Vesicomyidisocius sp. SY067_SCS001 TaxID=2732590 RepID=UPI001EEDC836|nr:hypothetical protein [Candidatus Vesicomyosocius sp. SY067_SCS001]
MKNRVLNVKELLSLYDLSSRIKVISFGESKPMMQQHDEGVCQKSRRVEFVYQKSFIYYLGLFVF